MDVTSPRWQTITESEFPWEREALAFVRQRLPDHEPYRAWSNFEFIADDGSINEVDLLVLTAKGFYLVEIKSRPGVVEGDRGTWTWRQDGRVQTTDNPLLLANRKAKKLISLLRRQPALQRKTGSPFLEAHVFLSAEGVDCRLGGSDWANLMRLVGHRALPRVRTELAAARRAVLLVNLGLLARYDQMTFLDKLRDAAGRPGGPPGVWLLVPRDPQESRPLIDGKPVPVFTAAQWASVPAAWPTGRRGVDARDDSPPA